MKEELVFPELPHPYYFVDAKSGAISIVVSTTGGAPEHNAEEVAWYWKPKYGFENKDGYDCVSAVKADANTWFRQQAPTEQEAINLIVSFALLGISKDG